MFHTTTWFYGVALTVLTAVPAIAQPASRPVTRPALESLHPTEQELGSASWWIERAVDEAERSGSARALWRAGVVAFDCGRFDLTRRVMAMSVLSDQDHETLGGRLVTAFEEAGDLDRLAELADAMRTTCWGRKNAFETLIKMRLDRNDLAAAERIADTQMKPGDRFYMYNVMTGYALEQGDLPKAWLLAGKAAAEEHSSATPGGYLQYIPAAAQAGKPEEVNRAVDAVLEIGKDWPTTMRADLYLELSEAMDKTGNHLRAQTFYGEAVKHGAPIAGDAGLDIETKDLWLNALSIAEKGQFDEALTLSEGINDAHQRACAFGGIAQLLARQKPADLAGARNAAVKAFAALRIAREAGETLYMTEQVAQALAAVGRGDDALAAIALEKSDLYRHTVLHRVAGTRAQAGDVAFVKLAIKSKVAIEADEWMRDQLKFHLAWAQAVAGDARGAAETAAAIRMPTARAEAWLIVARSHMKSKDISAFNDAIFAAVAAADAEPNKWGGERFRDKTTALQAELLLLKPIWNAVLREANPDRRAGLLTGAAEGLLNRMRDGNK